MKDFLSLCIGTLVVCSANGAEEPAVLPVWPGTVPGDDGAVGPERVRAPSEAPTKDAKWITNVTKPALTIFPAAKDNSTGAAIIICPGGGYWNLAWDLEGEEVAAWFNKVGVTAAVLKYRVPRRAGQPEALPAPGPLLDAQRAVSLVRSRAAEWSIDPNRVGILGFSGGGHLALATATHFDQRAYEAVDEIDKVSCRPDFAMAVYPGYLIEQRPAGVEINKNVLAPYIRIPKDTPPIFLVHATDDPVAGAENSALMYLALRRAHVPAELHVYAQGGHGFGVRQSSLACSTWADRSVAWLQNLAMLGTKPGTTALRNLPASADDWAPVAPREEIRPQFQRTESGGKSSHGALIIRADEREGLHGWWQKTFSVTPGLHYRFSAWRRAESIAVARRSVLARVLWRDAAGKQVPRREGVVTNFSLGVMASAEPEYPQDIIKQGAGSNDWIEVSGIYQAPPGATRAHVELHLLWAPKGQVEWSDVSFGPTEPPALRKVRLACVHYRPRAAKTPMDACRQFGPLIEEAARHSADLVVLGETLTYAGVGSSYEDCAESIPGLSTDYFGGLAKRHQLYVVAGLIERDRHQLFNVAVLIGPDGKLVGKYRKVCLPDGEYDRGMSPGTDYPVFDTRLGKVGMMICYDGFFPEVARELSNRGAEIIAWPVWGCNPEQARARACENHVYVVSSTYEDASRNWMFTGVVGRDGSVLAQAKEFGTVCVSEVDLNQSTLWTWLGDFKAQIPRQRPIARGE